MAKEAIAVLSSIDSERFGIRVARAPHVTVDVLPGVLRFCISNTVDLLIARCANDDLVAAQSMEARGFLLTDTLVYYSFDLAKRPIPEDAGKVRVRPLRPEDETQVQGVAAASFKGYFGDYRADPRLVRRNCDEAYFSWAT